MKGQAMKRRKHFMPNPNGRKPGFINEFIAFAVVVFAIIVAFLLCVEPLKKNTVHNEVFDLTNAALQQCEAKGGLTTAIEDDVLAKAKKYNLDPSAISFVYKINGVETSPLSTAATYPSDSTNGSDISLTINYAYTWHQLNLIGFTSSQGDLKTTNLGSTQSGTLMN